MADNVDITPGTGATVSTEQVTTLNGGVVAAQHIQRMLLAYRSADGTAIDLPADSTYGLGVDVKRSALPTDAATQTTLAAVLAKLSADPATQTTLAAVLAKLTADPATQTTLAAILAKLIAAPSTEAKQDALIAANHTDLLSLATKLDTLHADVDGLEGKDYATQTTLAALLAKVIAAPSTEAKQDALIALLPAALSSGRFKVEATPTSGATFSVDSSRPTTGTLANVASSATSVTVLASNASRKGATIVNESTAILYLKFGTTASATSYTVAIPAQVSGQIPSFYVLDAPCYTGRIDGIWASANGNARVTENT